VDFDAGVLPSADTLRVVLEPGAVEVPAAVTGAVPWPDGSVMAANLAFPAEDVQVRNGQFWVVWGETPRARTFQFSASSQGRTVPFVIGAPPPAPVLDMQAGQLVVRLDKHPEYFYYWYLIPIGAILALLIYRKVQMR
jgi:hypothetical protein